MDSEGKIIIGYSGSLSAYDPLSKTHPILKWMKNYLWTYRNDNLNHHTRSGYFLFRGIKLFKERYPRSADKLRVVLWGLIDRGNSTQVAGMEISDIVKIENYFSKKISMRKLENCDLLFLPLESSKNGQKPIFIPGKLFDFLKIGKPILALAENSDCKDILLKSGIGIVCNPFDENEIAETLHEIISNFDSIKERYNPNMDYIETNFNFRNITSKMAEVFNDLTTKNV